MKKLFKIPSIKALVLGQLLLGSLCVSAHADWNHQTLAKMEKCLSAQGHIDGIVALQNIDRYTSAALAIAAEILRNIQGSGAKVKDLAEQKKSIEAVANAAKDIQTRIDGLLTTATADTDPMAMETTLIEIVLAVATAHDNFTVALGINHQVQTKIERLRPAYRMACYQ
ncbi:MAG: hypothetical protein LBD54_01405 [Puniceicoccales bacterium]|jgi:hypothetical protein|nr:hypothetical protein [Puniceicoccales bacterium]